MSTHEFSFQNHASDGLSDTDACADYGGNEPKWVETLRTGKVTQGGPKAVWALFCQDVPALNEYSANCRTFNDLYWSLKGISAFAGSKNDNQITYLVDLAILALENSDKKHLLMLRSGSPSLNNDNSLSSILRDVTFCRYCWRLARIDTLQGSARRGTISPNILEENLFSKSVEGNDHNYRSKLASELAYKRLKTDALCIVHLDGKVDKKTHSPYRIEMKISSIERQRQNHISDIIVVGRKILSDYDNLKKEWLHLMRNEFKSLYRDESGIGRAIAENAWEALDILDEFPYSMRDKIHRRIKSNPEAYQFYIMTIILRADLWREITTKRPPRRRSRRNKPTTNGNQQGVLNTEA